jgi:DNA-binding PadR family transcriptional regulator
MHGHALRLLAEEEHIDEWAEVSPGAIYGAIKRLAAEELIEPLRLEREGNYPERQVYEISSAGVESLSVILREALDNLVYRPDPVDLALARLDEQSLDTLRETLENRMAEIRARIDAEHIKLDRIGQYLTLMERHLMNHDIHRLRGELAWHEEMMEALPAIIDDEKSRKAD